MINRIPYECLISRMARQRLTMLMHFAPDKLDIKRYSLYLT